MNADVSTEADHSMNMPVASTSTLPSPPPAADPPTATTAVAPPVSKNQLRKLRKHAEYQANKLERRVAEKERKRARRAKEIAELKSGNLPPERLEQIERKRQEKRLKDQARSQGMLVDLSDPDAGWRGGLVIDLGFDELMNEQEIKSMSSQLGFVYNINRMSSKPFRQIVNTSFNGRLAARMEGQLEAQHRRWLSMLWTTHSLDDLVARQAQSSENATAGGDAALDAFKAQEYVYLSADSDYELETLSESQTYIIGGIVDRNRHKNLCQQKAERLGIKTARLPIGKYLAEMPTRKVLTVNQVFDILVKYNELQDWKEAFLAVMPQRKFTNGGKTARRRGSPADDDGDSDDGNEEETDQGAAHATEADPATQLPTVQLTAEEEEAMMNEM